MKNMQDTTSARPTMLATCIEIGMGERLDKSGVTHVQ